MNKNGKLKGLGISMLVCPAGQWSSGPRCMGRVRTQPSPRPVPPRSSPGRAGGRSAMGSGGRAFEELWSSQAGAQ